MENVSRTRIERDSKQINENFTVLLNEHLELKKEVSILKLIPEGRITTDEYNSLVTQLESGDTEAINLAEALLEKLRQRPKGYCK